MKRIFNEKVSLAMKSRKVVRVNTCTGRKMSRKKAQWMFDSDCLTQSWKLKEMRWYQFSRTRVVCRAECKLERWFAHVQLRDGGYIRQRV